MPLPPDPNRVDLAGAVRRRIPTGLGGGVFWLALWFALLWLLRLAPIPGRSFLGWMEVLVGATLFSLTLLLAVRLIRRRFLWSLRNKLILTYLLIGLAPVVMLLTLAVVLAYFATGQFSIHLADSRMHQQLDDLSAENAGRISVAVRVIKLLDSGVIGPQRGRPRSFPRHAASPPPVQAPPAATPATRGPAGRGNTRQVQPTVAEGLAEATPAIEALPDTLRARLHPHTRTFLNGVPWAPAGVPSAPDSASTSDPLGFPTWAADLHDREFHGLVLNDEDLYLVAIDQRIIDGKGILTSVTSLPVDDALMDLLARGLGGVELMGLRPSPSGAPSAASASALQAASRRVRRSVHIRGVTFSGIPVDGGVQPLPVNFCDFLLPFGSTLDTTDWETGQPSSAPAMIEVWSRPSLLYRQLFGSSLGGIVNQDMRNGLIALCTVFALIEVLALWMAIRLFRALTASVHELYEATRRIDRGDLVHLIPADHAAKRDQLGELSGSFNRMTGSLARLLAEQQEKERMQSELTIAQEVQANLFPHRIQNLPSLELHGICRPARSVSGDYYDFFIFHGSEGDDGAEGLESGVGIALGDISGKGISAALLMATLHSAVRAYRLASADIAFSRGEPKVDADRLTPAASGRAPAIPGAASAVLTANAAPAAGGELFASPARILSLVNRHLYVSTQPEKYATLFLAHYDAPTARLTYSNAGHLPPIILGRDGSVRRLDRGGTVVGLIQGAEYEDDSIQLRTGDIFIGYSDGVTEPENDFGEFGESRLIETVARYRHQPLEVVSAQVMLALDAWIGDAEQPDDITLVLARGV